jgi:hypothetical protein
MIDVVIAFGVPSTCWWVQADPARVWVIFQVQVDEW